MNTSKYEVIIWDFNGTIMDDVGICLETMNGFLKRFGLPLLDLDSYRAIFRFPVQEYYAAVGVTDFVPFTELAGEFMDKYNAKVKENGVPYFPDIIEVIKSLKELKIPQIILSASKQSSLVKQVEELGISSCFTAILGIDDIYADNKIEIAERWLAKQPKRPGRMLLIGDSEHDQEIAELLGAECVLISRGHVSKERLMAGGKPVFTDASHLVDYINGKM